ncbi:MAG: HlyD family efflux transporter periplasmic adaptor subunit [Oceanospirillaceae bacterium]|nr:HlyD family efflux transporter periplasmic adaptor subunit [Oceanospirillaceae bacterium]
MRLPALRSDLQLSPSAAALDGSPQWTLADPIRGRYFKLGDTALRLLRHWALGDAQRVLAAANAEPGATVGETELARLLQFLRDHDLIGAADSEQRASYGIKAAARRRRLWQRLLHQYLFFRIPLWRPDAFLNRTWPGLARYGPRMLKTGLPAVLALGLFLALRDWERFLATFPYLFSLSGALAFGSALLFAKLCHELGHAYMAKRAGCRVQSMGVAFVVLFPLFYTDVSDAWRVTDRRTRLLIGAGGILAELLLAAVALLAWSLLPDGPWRTAAFMLASATWLTTLAVNLNPFLRFDGYYLLADLWRVENLQDRAFALCRWRLREALFGYGAPMPEPWSPSLYRRLLAWGYCAWLWRAALFLTIALLVYHLFFKLLGTVLLVVELGWFIGRPVAREMREWWRGRSHARPVRLLLAGLALTGGLILLLVPWRSDVDIPARLAAVHASALHAPMPARVDRLFVDDGQPVRSGDPLLQLESPDLDARQAIVDNQIRILRLQLRRQAARPETAADAGILEPQLAEALAESDGLAAQRARLLVRAPHDGVVRDLLDGLAPGRWLEPQSPLLRVVGQQLRLRGYLPEQALWRVEAGAPGLFIADDPLLPALAVRLEEISTTGVAYLDIESLASDRAGPMAVRRDEQGRAKPLQAQYAVNLVLLEDIPVPAQTRRGLVVVQGREESIIGGLVRRLAALGIRESGF